MGLRLLLHPKWSSTATASSKSATLSKYLAETIKATGPISLAAFMRQCLTNPEAGYYINKDPFGKEGDFITSPEISQMFGELIGVWFLTQLMLNQSVKKIRLVELGPGRGTLMDDMLRTSMTFADFHKNISEVIMVEASPTLRNVQSQLLCGSECKQGPDGRWTASSSKYDVLFTWVDSPKDINDDSTVSTFVVVHEFFDALPIHQLEKTEKGWRELLVDFSADKPNTPLSLPNQTVINASPDTPKFHLTLSPSATPASEIISQTHERYDKLNVGSRVEICPEAWEVSSQIGRLVSSASGSALIIDYGAADTIPINTLRGVKNHKIVSPFEEPGTADLSADVDFQAIGIASKTHYNVEVHGPVEQGDWLHAMGIGARASMLANNQTTEEGKKRIAMQYKRLVDKGIGGMGKLYKVMAITASGCAKPAGFGGEL